mmetsp:Transcript_2107/g.6288  ORF Transcript_2107/g.6288 Transcript_2107/m.6288 type:complete len:203 (+) Transcript_2107:955-1563(+)
MMSKCTLRDAVEGEVVVPLQCILPGQRHARCRCRSNDLLQQTLRGAASFHRVLAVPHLHTCEADSRPVACNHLQERVIAIAVASVIVPGCQLSSMRPRLVPPVHTGQLHPQVARRCQLVLCIQQGTLVRWTVEGALVRPLAALGHAGELLHHALSAARSARSVRSTKGGCRGGQHCVGMLLQHAAVPAQEEVTILAFPGPAF